MDKMITIESVSGKLIEIQQIDCENLRRWKNQARKSFFFQEIINEKQQLQWFEGYKRRRKKNEDFMFVAQEGRHSIGCLGYRIEGDVIDLYNIIRGEQSISGFTMAEAMKMMLGYIMTHYSQRITCKVLKTNPAFTWYKRLGFSIVEEKDTYYLLEYIETVEMEGAIR